MNLQGHSNARTLAICVVLTCGCGGDDAGMANDTHGDDQECGGHGHLHGDHCHCEEGYEPRADNPRNCVPVTLGERLVVADPEARRVYVFDAGTWDLVAEFPEVAVDDHVGFLDLGDGRLLFVDKVTSTLRVATISGVERPTLDASVPFRGTAAHIAIDPGKRYAIVSASDSAAEHGWVTIVDLQSLGAVEVAVASSEPGIALGGAPLQLFHRSDVPPQLEMFPLAGLLQGGREPVDSVPIGGAPHGEVIAHGQQKIVVAADDGINVVSYGLDGFGEPRAIAYDVGGFVGGRAFHARLAADGRFLYSYLRDSGPEGTTWGGWRSDAYVVDLVSETASRMPIGPGLVYRLGMCPSLVAFTQYHPDGDFLHLLDGNPTSSMFQQFVAKIPLERMTKAPGPDGDVWASEAFRTTALSADCRWAFVTHGGDGKVSVIDTSARQVVHTLQLPTLLDYGGYLVSVRSGVPLVDTIGR